jgi:hypothetical protein
MCFSTFGFADFVKCRERAAFKKEWRERGKNWRFPEIWARRAFFNGENGKENGSYTCNAL